MKKLFLFSVIITAIFSCEQENETLNPAPVVSFTDSLEARTFPATVAFTNLSNTTSGGATYSWSFGDGGSSTQINPVHQYGSAGTFAVELVQTTNAGIKDTVRKLMLIHPVNPGTGGGTGGATGTNEANFTFAAPLFASYRVYLKSTSENANKFVWHFGDGTIDNSNVAAVSHTYFSKGNYTVKLIASGPGGTDSVSRNITVQ